jgi:hypothetical protein
VFARFRSDGSLSLLDQRGRSAADAGPGTGIVAAIRDHGKRPLWIVSGVDAAGTERAAGALRAGVLRDAFAVAVTPEGVRRLPMRSGG